MRYPNSPSFDPGLLYLEDDQEPDPEDPELLTLTPKGGWWSSPVGEYED